MQTPEFHSNTFDQRTPLRAASCRTGSATADYNVIGVRPSSGAASTGCSDASDSIGGLARVPTLLRPRTGALRRGDPPPSLTQYKLNVLRGRLIGSQVIELSGAFAKGPARSGPVS